MSLIWKQSIRRKEKERERKEKNQTKSVNFDTMERSSHKKERITELFDEVISAMQHEFV